MWPSRAAQWFAAFAFLLAQAGESLIFLPFSASLFSPAKCSSRFLGTNISTNSIASSNDLTFLFPKYVNIKRGAFITAVLGGWATAPWKIQASGTVLLNFLTGYAIVSQFDDRSGRGENEADLRRVVLFLRFSLLSSLSSSSITF